MPPHHSLSSLLTRRIWLSDGAICRQCRVSLAATSRTVSQRTASTSSSPFGARRPKAYYDTVQFPKSAPRRTLRTVESVKAYNRMGVRRIFRLTLFIVTGVSLIVYFQYEKGRLDRKRVTEMSKGYGRPKVGGPFTLTDLDGNEFTENDLMGKYNIIYFGFTHCPDICPDELDKLSILLDTLHKSHPNVLRPVFISCDPFRDTPTVLRQYLSEFHPNLVGLTGTWEQVKNVCKQYRVYFSTPPDIKAGEEDYLVDHSIYFYVMDPEGDFVECIGRQNTAEDGARIIGEHIKDWKREGKVLDTSPLKTLFEEEKK